MRREHQSKKNIKKMETVFIFQRVFLLCLIITGGFMNSEFERLLELLYALVTELLKEQENSDNTNNKLDLCVLPSIHQAGGQYDENA